VTGSGGTTAFLSRTAQRCGRCPALIVFVTTEASRSMPIDLVPDVAGNIAVHVDGAGRPRGRVVTTERPVAGFEQLHLPHFATCGAHQGPAGRAGSNVVPLYRKRAARRQAAPGRAGLAGVPVTHERAPITLTMGARGASVTQLTQRRSALPARMYGQPRAARDDVGGQVLTGELLAPGEAPGLTAEDVAKGWLLTYAENENTTRSYHRTIVEWFGFCAQGDVDPLAARRALVELYKNWLYDTGRAPSTVGQRLTALSSFYLYAEGEDVVRRSPLRGVRRPQLPDQSSSTGLSREELNAFLVEASRRGGQMYALMVLLGLNGLRSSEPLRCQVEDLGTERGHRTLAVTRKGKAGKVRVPLAPITARTLDLWLEERARGLFQVGKGSGQLFFKIRRGTGVVCPLDRRDVHRYVRSIGRAAVPDKPSLHPHDLRHAFVTLSLDAGVPLRDVQDSAGHASPTTTRRYDQNRNKVDRHATYTLAAYLAGSSPG